MDITPSTDPLILFENWMAEAKAHPHIREATAMAVATLSREGELLNRVVLCKGWSKEGFVFFTNYDSRKGLDLQENALTGVVFYWDALFRQVKIEGTVEKTSRQVSENYWRTRPRESQISQFISKQSQPAPERKKMEEAWAAADTEFRDREIPCPEHWGGYLIRPKSVEFWIGRPGRFHDRHVFEKTVSNWTYSRLYP